MQRFQGAYRGFREPDLFAGLDRTRHAAHDFGSFDRREGRYALLWAFAQQQGYRDLLDHAAGLREAYGSYQGIRDLFGVSHQLAEFWTAHLQGGEIDILAGDGHAAPSALPILMDAENPAVREGLAELFKRSNWSIGKDIAARFNAALGDVFLEVCDDAEAATIRLNPVYPGRVKWCDLTGEGNVEAYELQYLRPDPRRPAKDESLDTPRATLVQYNELVTPGEGGLGIRFRTYLDRDSYPWPGNESADFTVPDLPFAPLVKIQHKNVGLGWGVAECAAAMTNSREAADLASILTDWSRRVLNSPRLMSGQRNPASNPELLATGRSPSFAPNATSDEFGGYGHGAQSDRESASRSDSHYIWTPNDNAKSWSLVDGMPVDGIGAQLDRVNAKNLADYPELSFERIRASGQASAEAIREARKPAESKVYARRVEIDAGSVRAFRMALTLGGLRGYRHYESFDAGSYDDGTLDFRIGPRPAFAPDPIEQIAERQARYAAVKAAADAGIPLGIAMKAEGYSDAEIAQAAKEKADAQANAMEMAKQAGPPAKNKSKFPD